MIWLLLISLIVVSLACAFLGCKLLTWTTALAITYVAFAVNGQPGIWSLLVTGLVLAAILVPLNVPAIRQQLITAPFLAKYRKMLPRLSDTEKAAMEAGTVGWEGELFSGKPDWKVLLDRPYLELTPEEQAFLDGPVEELCGMLRQWEISHELADLPPEVWEFCKQNKFFGMIIPKEYGGLGFTAMGHRAVLQKISSISAVAGSNVAVPNSLGPAELLLHYGTEEQKNHYLPRLAAGKDIPCFALTGPTAGSDATSIPDYGVICKGRYKGKEVLGMRLNFDKRYITLAPVATVIGLAVKLYDPDGLLGDQKELGISLALVPRDTEGLEIGSRHFPLNVPFQNGPVRGKDVFLPLDTLIGGADMIGKGWRMLVEVLSIGRAITLPSSSTGGAKMGSLATGAYARIRKQFNLPIGRFEGVEEALSRIAGKTYQISALSRMTATAVDLGEKPAVPSAIAKYHATEMASEIIKDVMDVHGGKGIILGPRNYLGRAWQGAPIWITVEGANIMTRNLMIFGQGAIRCHPYVLKEIIASKIEDEDEALREFDTLLFGHIGYSIRNAVRSFILGFSRGRLTRVPVPHDRRLSSFYRKLNRYAAAMAFMSDIAMLTLGGKLKHKEHISARLGDALSQLYICSAMLARYEAQDRPSQDQPILAWAFHDAIFKIQTALGLVADNFPNRYMRALLNFTIFPLGRRERRPGDRLSHRVAQLLLSPSKTRDRLTSGVFISPDHPVGFMEQALPEIIAVEPLERKLHKALAAGKIEGITWEEQLVSAVAASIISETEAESLKQARLKVHEIIAVDEFESEALRLGQPGRDTVRTSEAA